MNKRSSITVILSCLTMVLTCTLMPLEALAYRNDRFYSSNDILFYDENDKECAPLSGTIGGGSGGGGGGATQEGNANLETILGFLTTGNGLSMLAAAGIAGNLYQESHSYSPTATQFGSPAEEGLKEGEGFGIAQWTDSGRQQALIGYAASINKPVYSLEAQLGFMWQEMQTYPGLMSDLNSLDPSLTYDGHSAAVEAAIIFHNGYEQSGDTAEYVISVRGGKAEETYTTYTGQSLGNTINTSGPSGTNSSSIGGILYDSNGCPIITGGGTGGGGGGGVPVGECLVDGATSINVCNVGGIEVAASLSQQLADMVSAAAAAGFTLSGSGFRTYDEQVDFRIKNCDGVAHPENIYDPNVVCHPDTALPGNSNHEFGEGIDFEGMSEGSNRDNNDLFRWMDDNAATFGFYNLPSEPWHWSTNGR